MGWARRWTELQTKNKLNPLFIKNAKPGKYCDGGNLWLTKGENGTGKWFLRVTIHGRRREMGLGSLQDVSLKEAREAAEGWKRVRREGKDPIKERQKLEREAARTKLTLAKVAAEAFESRKAELREDGKAGRWFSPLVLHVLPKLGRVPIEDIDQIDIKNVLAPLWHTKSDTARKAANRLSIAFKYAAALGLDVDLQAVDKARALLGKPRHKTQNIPAMDWRDVPEFYASLDEGSVTHLALRLLILTANRSKPIRFIRKDQIYGDVWIIPAENVKSTKGKEAEFRVPLSTEAQSVVDQAMMHLREGYFFPSVRRGVISDATMSRFMERKGLNARPHGFRSSFRVWCAEATDTPRELAEIALGHKVGNRVEQTYHRTDLLEKRRILFERWGNFVAGRDIGEIIQLDQRAADGHG
jgi:integrase